MTDANLLSQYRNQGSHQAFEVILKRYWELVYAIALQQVRAPSLATDIAQTVFSKLASSPAGLPGKVAVDVWLCRVARSSAIDAVRREESRRRREQQFSYINSLPQDREAQQWTESEAVLDEAMEELPEMERRVIQFRFYRRLSYDAVGSELGISGEAARKRLAQALQRMRGILQRRGIAFAGTLPLFHLIDDLPHPPIASPGIPAVSSLFNGRKSLCLRQAFRRGPSDVGDWYAKRWFATAAVVVAGIAFLMVRGRETRQAAAYLAPAWGEPHPLDQAVDLGPPRVSPLRQPQQSEDDHLISVYGRERVELANKASDDLQNLLMMMLIYVKAAQQSGRTLNISALNKVPGAEGRFRNVAELLEAAEAEKDECASKIRNRMVDIVRQRGLIVRLLLARDAAVRGNLGGDSWEALDSMAMSGHEESVIGSIIPDGSNADEDSDAALKILALKLTEPFYHEIMHCWLDNRPQDPPFRTPPMALEEFRQEVEKAKTQIKTFDGEATAGVGQKKR